MFNENIINSLPILTQSCNLEDLICFHNTAVYFRNFVNCGLELKIIHYVIKNNIKSKNCELDAFSEEAINVIRKCILNLNSENFIIFKNAEKVFLDINFDSDGFSAKLYSSNGLIALYDNTFSVLPSNTEKYIYSLVDVVKQFQSFIPDKTIYLKTNNKSINWLLTANNLPSNLFETKIFLDKFNFKTEWSNSENNIQVFRVRPHEVEVLDLNVIETKRF